MKAIVRTTIVLSFLAYSSAYGDIIRLVEGSIRAITDPVFSACDDIGLGPYGVMTATVSLETNSGRKVPIVFSASGVDQKQDKNCEQARKELGGLVALFALKCQPIQEGDITVDKSVSPPVCTKQVMDLYFSNQVNSWSYEVRTLVVRCP